MKSRFGLDIDPVQREGILPDDAIDTAVAGATQMLSRAFATAVSHGCEEVENEPLEKLRWLRLHAIQQVIPERCL